MSRYSLTRRISSSFAVLSACVLLGLGWFLYRSLDEHVSQSDAVELAGKVGLVRHILSEFGSEESIIQDSQRLRAMLVGHPHMILRVQRKSGETLFASAEWLAVQKWPDKELSLGAAPGAARMWSPETRRQYSVVSLDAKLGGQAASAVTVFLGIDVTEHAQILRRLFETLAVALTAALLAATLLGWWIAHRELRVVKKIAGTAQNVSSSRLGARIDLSEAPVELHDLVGAFNAMLARLEESFGRLSQFSNDLAHEFRTPIHNLMMQAQVTLKEPRTAMEYRKALEANTEEFERLARLVEDMLFLARADQAQMEPEMEQFDLRDETDKVAEYFEPLAEHRAVRIVCDGHAVVHADRRLVERVISNLIANAVNYGSESSTIRIRIDRDDADVRLTVSNEGTGIPPEIRARIFDRFFQANPSRSEGGQGWGLGLAIVKSIMELHGGRIDVQNEPVGQTSFVATFPRMSKDHGPSSSPRRVGDEQVSFPPAAAL